MKLTRIVAALSLVLFASPAFASDLLYISEYTTIGNQANARNASQIAQQSSLDQVTADFTSAAVQSNAFQGTTSIVRLWCSAQCSVAFGVNPTATANNMPLAAGVAEYFAVPPGQGWKVSVHTNP